MNVLKMYEKMSKLPMGKYLFSKAVCKRAPYFSTIHPLVTKLSDNECEIKIKNKRSMQNHIGSVHAIAMCNQAEMCAGLCIETFLPKHLRWIPKEMNVKYLAKGMTELTGKCSFDPESVNIGDNDILVEVRDTNDVLVFTAEINMWVSEK